MKYKIVPGPRAIDGKDPGSLSQFEKIMNSNAVDGWRYHSMEVITMVTKQGCGNQPPTRTDLYMLIFEKED